MLYFEEACMPWKECGPCQGHEMTGPTPLGGHPSKRTEGELPQGRNSVGKFGREAPEGSMREMKTVEPVPLAGIGKNGAGPPFKTTDSSLHSDTLLPKYSINTLSNYFKNS